MDYAELLEQVQVAGALDRAPAEQVIVATVVTLAERMSHDELERLGARLPAELRWRCVLAHRAASPLTPMSSSAGSPSGWEWSRRRSGRMCGRCRGTLEREVAEMEAVRRRLPREFDALMA
jgi:Uncharacterized conserved protein (DUF2267)